MDQAHRTQVWLAVSNDPKALVSGRYFYHLRQRTTDLAVHDTARQDRLLDICRRLSGIPLAIV
jgi:predicted ATPase